MTKQHGGKRTPGPGKSLGRPTMQKGRKNLIIDASDEEYQEIIKALTTRNRTVELLRVVRQPSDEDLIQKIVRDQVDHIQLSKQFRDNPLAQPSLTPEQRKCQDDEWNEAIRRDLHNEINKRIHGRKVVQAKARATAGVRGGPACPICGRVDDNHLFDKKHD